VISPPGLASGDGQMAFEAQLGKQIFHPEVQLLATLFEGRLVLSLKLSDLSVMQEVAPFFVVFINYLNKLACKKSRATLIVIISYLNTIKYQFAIM